MNLKIDLNYKNETFRCYLLNKNRYIKYIDNLNQHKIKFRIFNNYQFMGIFSNALTYSLFTFIIF
jgi:hypothetical protein